MTSLWPHDYHREEKKRRAANQKKSRKLLGGRELNLFRGSVTGWAAIANVVVDVVIGEGTNDS
jgi:hypothetical protein